MELYENFSEMLREIAQLSRIQVEQNLLIALRVLVALCTIIVINAQLKSWRLCHMNWGRWATVIGWACIGTAAMMSALITTHLGGNAALFQLLFNVGVMLRLSADIANAGQRRAKYRARRERMCNRDHR